MALVPKGRYEYSGVELADPSYFVEVAKGRLGQLVSVTIYPAERRIVVQTERELAPSEKSMLDSLVMSNPVPASTYEYGPVDAGDVEREVGVRPVLFSYEPASRTARLSFDRALTPEQEAKLSALLEKPMRLRKRPQP
jgi:hypothetical protein